MRRIGSPSSKAISKPFHTLPVTYRGMVRVRRSGSPSSRGDCVGSGGGQCEITCSSSSRLIVFSSSTCAATHKFHKPRCDTHHIITEQL